MKLYNSCIMKISKKSNPKRVDFSFCLSYYLYGVIIMNKKRQSIINYLLDSFNNDSLMVDWCGPRKKGLKCNYYMSLVPRNGHPCLCGMINIVDEKDGLKIYYEGPYSNWTVIYAKPILYSSSLTSIFKSLDSFISDVLTNYKTGYNVKDRILMSRC